MDDLPVAECLPETIAALQSGQPVILRAPPGAGKTTGVPPALLQAPGLSAGKILLLQPRRMAARAAAHRLALQCGETVGQTYGYHVRFDRKVSRSTTVIAMTNGVLLRQLASDPLLEDVACVILDEFHERSLELDLVLGMLQRIRLTFRPELRLIVMSATLDTDAVASLLPDAAIIESQGRAFEVEVRYAKTLSRERIENQVADRLPQALQSSDGDVLVFLPGVGEIHRTAECIHEIALRESIEVHKLYGDLPPDEQDAVLRPSEGRKIVLATNVAETSITIPNVTTVIDSGLARMMEYDSAVGLPSLRLNPISKASAEQRAGRAGRTAPGVCFRLWPQTMQRARPDQTPPEVARTDLSAALLTLAVWGERDVFEFPWVTTPTEHAVESAQRLLRFLGAIDAEGEITDEGKRMASLPVHPRLAKLLITAAQCQCLHLASLAAAMLGERDPFNRSARFDAHQRKSMIESDLLERVIRLRRHLDGQRDPDVHPAGAKNIGRIASQLRKMVDHHSDDEEAKEANFSRSLLAAYPDRLAAGERADLIRG